MDEQWWTCRVNSSMSASLVSEVNGSKKVVLSMVLVHSTSELKVIGSELGGLDCLIVN
jgi:hypothetical protein